MSAREEEGDQGVGGEKLLSQFRIIIAGGRHFNDYETFRRFVQEAFEKHGIQRDQAEIISGHCPGVDQMGGQYGWCGVGRHHRFAA